MGVLERVEKFETRLASLETSLATFERTLQVNTDHMDMLHARIETSVVWFWLTVVVVALVTSFSGNLLRELAQFVVARWMS